MKLHWRIRHKLVAGLVLVLGMTGLLSAGSFYGLYSYRLSNKISNCHHEQLALLGYLVTAVSDLNFLGRDVHEGILNPEMARREKQARLERIEAMLASYRSSLEQVEAWSFSPEGIQRQLAELDQMRGYLDQLKSSVSGREPSAGANRPSELKPWWYTGSERDIIAKLVNALNQFSGVIHSEITQHVERDRGNYRLSMAVVYSSAALVCGMLVGLVWLGYRTVLYPIRVLHRGVLKLSDQKFDSRVHLDSGDEMQELGEAFNQMADRLQSKYDDLKSQVEERSRQLIRSERLASVGFLAAGVAHEINNPLASIAFCGEAIESRFKKRVTSNDDDADVIFSYLQMIQEESFRCKAITERLLDFSRVGEPTRSDTDLVELIRGVIEMVQHLGRTKGKHVVFEPAEMVVARVNAQEMKQVLLNLVINALESLDEGGTVVIEARQRGEDQAEISVRDNGCGMSPEVLENLFEPFFTRNRTGKGTGLGLSISHLIVSQHGGTLDAASVGANQGSTFTVRLPRAALVRQAA